MSEIRKIDELDQKFKITIDNNTTAVSAPLHNDFGFTVGSEYTTPFDIGSMSGMIQKAFALGKVSAPVGLRMRKMYANPEPTELSFRMAFDAYYDAYTEVVRPVIDLVTMGLGREMTDADIKDKINDVAGLINSATSFTNGTKNDPTETVENTPNPTTMSGRLAGLIKMVNAPSVCTLKFGELITFDDVFITSTAVTFSNNMDARGLPMSAEVNVTCTLQTAPIAEDIIRYFERRL